MTGIHTPSDDELREAWRNAGGSFHGPHVETGTMPETELFVFLRGMLKAGEMPLALVPTFNERLEQIRLDLASIVDRMNRDHSEPIAMSAQMALNAVAQLQRDNKQWFVDLSWDWGPGE